MKSKKYKPKIMVSSTVYGFTDQITQIAALLKKWGYEVWNSHLGTIKTSSQHSTLEDSVISAKECDLFLGIIRTTCGSGNIGDKNITFEEMKAAIDAGKPYWFIVHHDVPFTRQLFKHIKNSESIEFKDKKFFDPLCLEMYNYAIKDDDDIEERVGNWVQEFYSFSDIATYLKTQFNDNKESIIKLFEERN